MSKELNTSGVLKSDYELKTQKQHSHLGFMWTILVQKISIFRFYLLNARLWKCLNTSGVLKSDIELKIQKPHSRLRFTWTILIHMDSAFKYTP